MTKYNYRIDLGASQFRRFVENDLLYIDKTMFVEHVLDDPSQVLMFTRPRRMGKTLNLDTLRTFIDTAEDSEDVKKLFKGLKFENSKYYDQMGTHPVIFLSFRDFHLDNKQEKFQIILKDITNRYLKKSEISDELQKIIDGDFKLLDSSVRFLSRDIQNATGKKPMIIIDEYDKLYMDSATEGEEAFKDAREFTKNIMSSCLKDNPHLFKAVITGVNRIAQESMFSDLNNVKVYGVFRKSVFDTDFGLTEEEVAPLIEDKNELKKVRDWYNNFRIGNNKIYFTYSVMSYLDDGNLGTYWTNSGAITLIKSGLTAKRIEQISAAINGEKFITSVEEKIDGEDLNTLKYDGAFYSLLVQTGYLTFDETDSLKNKFLSIPNVELQNAWQDYILKNVFDAQDFQIIDVFNSPEKLRDGLGDLLNNKLSYFDFQKQDHEAIYHAFLAGMLAVARIPFKSNRESGRGRYDILTNQNGTNYIFEFKKATTPENIEESSSEAIAQIREKNYAADVDNNDPTYLVGIGFHLKESQVKIEQL
jgi:hypothetical protein